MQLSPATLLPLPENNIPHDCIMLTGQLLTLLLDPRESPFPSADLEWFADGYYLRGPNGNYQAGYTIVSLNKIIEPSLLPDAKPAQQAELPALTDRRTQELKSLALAIVDRLKGLMHVESHYSRDWNS